MGRSENAIESPVCEYAEDQGFLVRKFNSPSTIGVPDQIFFGFGTVFLIEFKSPNGRLEPYQKREINRIREHGVRVFVVGDVEFGKSIIDGAKRVGEANGWHATT